MLVVCGPLVMAILSSVGAIPALGRGGLAMHIVTRIYFQLLLGVSLVVDVAVTVAPAHIWLWRRQRAALLRAIPSITVGPCTARIHPLLCVWVPLCLCLCLLLGLAVRLDRGAHLLPLTLLILIPALLPLLHTHSIEHGRNRSLPGAKRAVHLACCHTRMARVICLSRRARAMCLIM